MDSQLKKDLDTKLGEKINYVTEVDKFLKDLISLKYIGPKEDWETDYFQILRKWNSYYPSFYDVSGGCYIIYYNGVYTVIDPGYHTLNVLRENRIDTRSIQNIIITHNHPDHNGGLIELLDLIYSQTSREDQVKYHLYINPGTEREYDHRKEDGQELIEIHPIKCQVETPLGDSKGISFFAYEVPHKGIGTLQKSIALIFKIEKNNKTLQFGLTGDLDGDQKYMESYKTIFTNLYFLIMHLGSMKYKSPSSAERKEDKHLYIDGAYQLIASLDTVKAFILQEFGLELARPEELTGILSKVLLSNGYYLPYLTFRMIISDENKNLQKYLLNHLIPLFLNSIAKKITQSIFGRIEQPDERKILDFSRSLCIGFQFDEKKNVMPIYHQFWKTFKQKIVQNDLNEITPRFQEIWSHLHNVLYLGICEFDNSFIDSKVKEIASYIQDSEFLSIIKRNCEILFEFIEEGRKNKILEKFEILFETRAKKDFQDYPDDDIIFRIRNLDSTDHTMLPTPSQVELIQLLPFLIFISELSMKKLPERNFDMITQNELKKDLLEFFQEKLKTKNIYTGDYPEKIYFGKYFKDEFQCSDHGAYPNLRDGTAIFNPWPPCPGCCEQEVQEEEGQLSYNEALEEEHDKALIEIHKQEEREEQIAAEKHEELIQLMQNQQFEEALKILRDQKYYSKKVLTKDILEILKEHLEMPYVKLILIEYFLRSYFFAESDEPENYAFLFTFFQKFLSEKVEGAKWDLIDKIMPYFVRNLRHYSEIFHKKDAGDKKFSNFRSACSELIKTIFLRLLESLYKSDPTTNSARWNQIFQYLADISNGIIEKIRIQLRMIIYQQLKLKLNENQLKIFKNDKKIIRIIKEKGLLSSN